jgi:small subunit ribosomal protein S16
MGLGVSIVETVWKFSRIIWHWDACLEVSVVRIRFARLGRPHRPFYRINVVDSRVKRDGVCIENLGWYNPMAQGSEKALDLNSERIKHWLSVGAQPSDSVRNLLAHNGLVDAAEVKKAQAGKIARKKKIEAIKAQHANDNKKSDKK